jgi:signal transduction histidine kinase/ActR/RegA family two-component response regulator
MATGAKDFEQRVLILAPIGRDARAAAQQLEDRGIACAICASVKDLHKKLEEGAAAAVVTEEALLDDTSRGVNSWVRQQPPWSDLPFVVLTNQHTSAAAHAYRLHLLEDLGNVSLLERPLGAVTLVSTVAAALRARRRQYEVRHHLLERENTAVQLEGLVEARTAQLQQANEQLRQQISERRAAEAALQQAQKMEVIGQMTGGVAHDFNNLLTAVIGNLELASRRNQAETIRRYLDGARQAAQRGAKLIAQLLAFSRIQRLQTEPTDLNTLVTAMGDLLFRTIGTAVRIETVLEKDLWPAMVDPSQLELVILNLAVNARDAMSSRGGRLTISTENIDRDHDGAPDDLAPGEYVALSVSDTGTGMTDEVLKKAYEPFFTTKGVGHGTGLGLSQVYGIAKQSNGGVRIETELGRGTTVTLFLPRTAMAPARSPLEGNVDAVVRPHSATILVVDDDRDVRELAVSSLETLGYQVLAAEGGRAALEVIGGTAQIDLVLVDMVMPEMNGSETARAAQRRRPGLPIVYMSAYVGPTPLEGVDQHSLLKKPFTLAELAQKVEEALAARREHGEHSNVYPIKPGLGSERKQ